MQTLSFDESRANLEKMGADDKLYFATVSDGNTGFQTEHSVYSNAANVFNYHYEADHEETPIVKALSLTRADGSNASQDWFIKVTGKTAEDNANFTAARALMDAGYAMGTELDTLNKRMGEARYLDDDQGLWVRYRHGRSSRDNSYETDSNMIQLGYDRKMTPKAARITAAWPSITPMRTLRCISCPAAAMWSGMRSACTIPGWAIKGTTMTSSSAAGA